MAKGKKDHWGDGKYEKNDQYKRIKKDDTDVPRKPNKKKEEKEPDKKLNRMQRKDNYERTKEADGYKNKKKPKWKDED